MKRFLFFIGCLIPFSLACAGKQTSTAFPERIPVELRGTADVTIIQNGERRDVEAAFVIARPHYIRVDLLDWAVGNWASL